MLCPEMAEERRELSEVPLIRMLISFMRAPPLPKASPPNIITLGARISTREFWGDRNIQSITVSMKEVTSGLTREGATGTVKA